MSKSGVFHPILVTKNGTILSGHQWWLTAKEIKMEELPCNVIDIDPDSDLAKKSHHGSEYGAEDPRPRGIQKVLESIRKNLSKES